MKLTGLLLATALASSLAVAADPTPDTISRAQQSLRMRGYDVGAVDGNMSPKTRQSIQEFQRAHAMPVTGELDDKTLAALDVGTAPAASGSSREAAGEHSKPAPDQTSGERYAEPKAPVDYTQQPQK